MSETMRKGKIGEYRFISEFIKQEYDVFIPVDESSQIDMITLKNGEFKKWQVKSITPVNGTLRINIRVFNPRKPTEGNVYDFTDIDGILVFDLSNEKGYILHSIEFEGYASQKWIRIEPPHSKRGLQTSKIVDAEQYRFF